MGISKEAGTHVILLRHGRSKANEEGLIAGDWDAPLTEEGRNEAIAARNLLDRFRPFHRVLSSDKSRASDTTHLATGIHPEQTRLLRERHFGTLEGMPVTEDVIKFLVTVPYRERYEQPPAPGGESDKDMMNHWDQLFDTRGRELAGKTTVMGTHASRIATLWAELDLVKGSRVRRVGNAGFVVLQATGNPRTPDFRLVHTSGVVYHTPALIAA